MTVRSFQQIIDAHEAAQAMLLALEVDVRDTLADAMAELSRFRIAGKPSELSGSVVWSAGDQFMVRLDADVQYLLDVTHGRVYTLRSTTYPGDALEFTDDVGDPRVFYSFWQESVTKVA